MKTAFSYLWTVFTAIVQAITSLIKYSIIIVLFLATLTELATFGIDYGNIVLESLRNIAARLALPELIAQSPTPPEAPKQCARYETRISNLHCENEEEPRKRFLCQITIPPAELVCVE